MCRLSLILSQTIKIGSSKWAGVTFWGNSKVDYYVVLIINDSKSNYALD
jgi:hypothetical protein